MDENYDQNFGDSREKVVTNFCKIIYFYIENF